LNETAFNDNELNRWKGGVGEVGTAPVTNTSLNGTRKKDNTKQQPSSVILLAATECASNFSVRLFPSQFQKLNPRFLIFIFLLTEHNRRIFNEGKKEEAGILFGAMLV